MSNIDYRRLILTAIGVAGFVSMAVLAPNALQSLALFQSESRRTKRDQRYYLSKVIERLKKQGLVKLAENHQGVLYVQLTPKGKAILQRYELSELQIPKPKRWDGKFRVVIFDIKEWKRGTRDELRSWLLTLGFIRLQNSVWVHPYDCEEILILLKSHFKIGREVLYLLVDKIEGDQWLRREFNLKSTVS